MADILLARRGRLLDFNRVNRPVLNDQQVNLFLVLVPVVVERSLQAIVPVAFQEFHNNPRLKNSPGYGPGLQGLGARPFGQVGTQTSVQHVKLRGLHKPFGDVRMVRLQQVDHSRSLEDGQPVLGRIRSNIGIPCQVGHVQELPRSGGTGSKEPEEGHFVTDLGQIPNVPLDVGLDVRTVKKGFDPRFDPEPRQGNFPSRSNRKAPAE